MNSSYSLLVPDARWRAAFRRRLLAWFDVNARRLPWRETSDPYRVWVSEIMLQQTQVETVLRYYQPFLQAFPDVVALAAASEQQVLRHWEGLGYYRRGRQMHAAAGIIVDQHDGRFPDDFDDVLNLPGIGRYTAGAVLSLALGQRHPILEANTVRLFSRLVGLREDPTKSASQRALWEFAESILPRRDVGRVNQAVMELGSLVCKPQNPLCTACPVARLCTARQTDSCDRIPAPKKKVKYQDVTEAAVVIQSRGKVLVRQCGAKERWAGLWDFPRIAMAATDPAGIVRELTDQMQQRFGCTIELGERFKTIKHAVTKYRITLHCYFATADRPNGGKSGSTAQPANSDSSQRWIRRSELEDLPLSVTGRSISRIIGAQSPTGRSRRQAATTEKFRA